MQAITASLAEFHGKNGGGLYDSDAGDFSSGMGKDHRSSSAGKGEPSFSVARWGSRGSHVGGSPMGEAKGRGASIGRSDRRGGASSAWAGDSGWNSAIGRGSTRGDHRVGWSGGAGSGSPPRKRRRPGSPNSPKHEGAVRLWGGEVAARAWSAA